MNQEPRLNTRHFFCAICGRQTSPLRICNECLEKAFETSIKETLQQKEPSLELLTELFGANLKKATFSGNVMNKLVKDYAEGKYAKGKSRGIIPW